MKVSFYERISENKNKTLLLFSFFIVFIMLLGWLFGEIFGIGFLGTFIAFILAIIFAFFSYYNSDKIVLRISGAREATKQEFPYYYNIVDALAIAAGIPAPKKYIIESNAMNAFATGRDPQHSAICVTTGLLKKLNRAEIEGVIAHEISHIVNYDIRTMMYAAVMVGFIVMMSDFVLRYFWYFGNGRREGRDTFGLIMLIIGILAAILAPIIAQLIKLAISRQREFLADATAAKLTRYPEGLASALEKIAMDPNVLETASNATAHLFIANPFKDKNWLHNLFSTHPPIEERIKRLRRM